MARIFTRLRYQKVVVPRESNHKIERHGFQPPQTLIQNDYFHVAQNRGPNVRGVLQMCVCPVPDRPVSGHDTTQPFGPVTRSECLSAHVMPWIKYLAGSVSVVRRIGVAHGRRQASAVPMTIIPGRFPGRPPRRNGPPVAIPMHAVLPDCRDESRAAAHSRCAMKIIDCHKAGSTCRRWKVTNDHVNQFQTTRTWTAERLWCAPTTRSGFVGIISRNLGS